MHIKQVDSNTERITVFNFCQTAITDIKKPASINIDPTDWVNQPHTLMHALFIQRRFDANNRAGYFLLEKEGKIIAGSGCYPLPEDPNICNVIVRGYTVKEERAKFSHGRYLLPKQIETAKQYNFKTLLFTVNEYNLHLKDGILKLSNGGASLGERVPESYSGWKSLDYPVTIQYTKQWCLYKHLDESYDRQFLATMSLLRTN